MRRIAKALLGVVSLVLVSPAGALCALERRMSHDSEAMFSFWAQAFALIPGVPGVMLRRAFYRMTLDHAARSFYVGFGAWFTHRHVIVEQDVYIGPYALVAHSRLRRGCMVGSRASLMSGNTLHELDSNGRWGPSNLRLARQIEIGEHALIGEGAIVMADIGPSAMVAAGAVVSAPVRALTVVAGNPARFAGHLVRAGLAEQEVKVHGDPVPAVH